MTIVTGGILPITEHFSFISSATLLLFVPGPTNTLLASRGALLGFRRAISGTFAEMFGYSLAILILRFLLEPIAAALPAASVLVQAACASYLMGVAYRLWIGEQNGDQGSPSCRQIFLTTLTNPKAFLFAFVILPKPTTEVLYTNLLNGFVLLALIIMSGTVWTMIGSLAVARAPFNSPLVIHRAAALVLVCFGLQIFANTAGTIFASH